jgi:glutaredoxin-like protein NrdH
LFDSISLNRGRMNFERVDGKDKGKITLYALSTCIWCEKTKKLLTSMGVGFNYIYVDLLKGDDRAKAINEVNRYNPSSSFPTLVIGDKYIVGYREKEIREALK